MKFLKLLLGTCLLGLLAACGGGGGSGGTVGGVDPLPLEVVGPLSLTMAPDDIRTFTVRNGKPSYSASSSDESVVRVVLTGTSLTVTAKKAGTAQIIIQDTGSDTVTMAVAVAMGPVTKLFTDAPSNLTLAVSSTQSYTVSGGKPPYVAQSSNPAVVSAGIQFNNTLRISGVAGGTARVLVTDTEGSTVELTIAVGSANALFSTAPSSITLQAGTTSSTFAVSGGSAPYTVNSSNTAVAIGALSGAGMAITAVGAGSAEIRIVDSRGVGLSINTTVTSVGTPAQAASTIEVLASSNTVPSAGGMVDITAYVKNTLNAGIADAPIAFTASSGLLQSVSAKTDANGVATAKLSPGANKANRAITVTVTSGGVSSFVTINVVGTTVSLTGDSTVQAGGTASYTVRVRDSAGNGIQGISVPLTSTLGNSFSPSSVVTDGSGTANSTYTALNAGTDTIKAAAMGSQSELTVAISNVSFSFISPASGTSINIGASQVLTVRYFVGAVAGTGNVTFSATRGTLVGANPAALVSGQASITLSATSAGPSTVVAQIPGVGQASITLNFVATTPVSMSLQANPGAVVPNAAGSTTNKSTIEALVVDGTGNPVPGQTVNFSIIQDLSGGTLSPASRVTGLDGRAQVEFIPGAGSTAENGVQINAVVATAPAVTGSVNLTVSGKALFISFGFGNTVGNVAGNSSLYSRTGTVYVTDSQGAAVSGQVVTLLVSPNQYSKGKLTPPTPTVAVWAYEGGAPTAVCPNEDANRNGILDGGEDANSNGLLTPGNVVFVSPGTVTTNGAGIATFELQYGEQYVPWLDVDLTGRTTVSGTESSNKIFHSLVGLSTDFNSAANPPAGTISPFGALAGCNNTN